MPDPIPPFRNTRPQPCPLRIDNGTLDIDTAKLPQGRHTVRILLEDAAGNRTPIFGPVVRTITANGAVGPGSDPALRGALNGSGASDQARLTAHWGRRGSRTLLVSRFGRAHVVRGRLRAVDGAPIADAAIDVVSRTTAVNARELVKRNGPRTRSDGSWFLMLPRRVSSRDSGRLLGGPLPRGGKQIVLMARASHGGWVRLNVVRTGAGGRSTPRTASSSPARPATASAR